MACLFIGPTKALCRHKTLEATHGVSPLLDASMVLLNGLITNDKFALFAPAQYSCPGLIGLCRKVHGNTLLSTMSSIFDVPSCQYVVWLVNFATEPESVALGESVRHPCITGRGIAPPHCPSYQRPSQSQSLIPGDGTILRERIALPPGRD